MLKIQYYSWQDLQTHLNLQFTKKNNRAKLINRNINPFYEYEIVKEGRKTIGLKIKGYKEKKKSEFIKLCEEIAGVEVSFPNEETAEKLLKVLLDDDRTILSYEELGKVEGLERVYTRQTISIYMQMFQQIGIIQERKPLIESVQIDSETGEILRKAYDPNKWIYYKVYKNERTVITYSEYREMHDFIKIAEHNFLTPLLDWTNGNVVLIKQYIKQCKKQAIYACLEKYGYLPKRALSKIPTEKARKIFESYYHKEQTADIETNKKVIKFKEFIQTHEFMRVPTYIEEQQVVENTDNTKLIITQDPFTKQQMVFNDTTGEYEIYREHEWVNGKKVEVESYIVPDMPPISRWNLKLTEHNDKKVI